MRRQTGRKQLFTDMQLGSALVIAFALTLFPVQMISFAAWFIVLLVAILLFIR